MVVEATDVGHDEDGESRPEVMLRWADDGADEDEDGSLPHDNFSTTL